MQLQIQRSQKKGFTGSVVFCLDLRAAYTQEEKDIINNYSLGGEIIYSSEAAKRHEQNSLNAENIGHAIWSAALARASLNITIASLARGHHIECKSMHELLEAEGELREACKNVTLYLDATKTFEGSSIVVEYANGQEKVCAA